MKTSILSIILVMMTCSCFSQNIILTNKQAKAVARDIVSGKACELELEQTQAVLELTETKVKVKDNVIRNLENQKLELIEKDSLRIEQVDSKDKLILKVEKQLKIQKKVSWIYKAGTFAGIILSGYLLVK